MREVLPRLEAGLLQAMGAIESQLAREFSSRNPEEVEIHGVSKTGPYLEKIEKISGFVLDSFEGNVIGLDSVIVMSQAFSIILKILMEELGREGLGDVRTRDCIAAINAISINCESASAILMNKETKLN